MFLVGNGQMIFKIIVMINNNNKIMINSRNNKMILNFHLFLKINNKVLINK